MPVWLRVAVVVPVWLEPVPVALDEGVPVWLPVPVELLEPVPVALDEVVPVWLPVPVALLEPVPVELLEPVPVEVSELEPVRLPVLVVLAEAVMLPVLVEDGVADTDDEPDAVALCEGVGRTMVTTMLSTSSDELPVDMPPPLTTDSRSITDAAGDNTADRRTQPEEPNVPTSATLTLYSTVVVTWPAASVATAVTCAESLRKSRDAK